MSSSIAGWLGPLSSADRCSRSLLVCTGAIALSYIGLTGLIFGNPALPALGLICLAGAATAVYCARRRIQESEERLRVAVQESQELESANADLRRFAMCVAHDLRAPLVSTKGMLDMAKETASEGELGDLIRLLDRATNTAHRMDGIISGILDMSIGAESQESELVDLNEVLANSLEDLQPSMNELGFELRYDDALGLVRGGARSVQQVFDNLVGNAVKYVRPTRLGQVPTLTISATRLRHSIQVSLSDNGPGIPESRREELLAGVTQQPTVQASPSQLSMVPPASGANLGLGLPLAKRAMEQCGGSLAIRTSPMGGTEFILEFRADPCVIPNQVPKSLPPSLTTAVQLSHPYSSSRTMLTTG